MNKKGLIFVLVMLCACTTVTFAVDVPTSAVHLELCKDGDRCSSSGADCSENISGCHQKGSCAYCSCGSPGCSCDCRGTGASASIILGRSETDEVDTNTCPTDRCIALVNKVGIPVIFELSVDEPWSINTNGLTFSGLMKLIKQGLPDDWTLMTTVLPENIDQLVSLRLGGTERSPSTVRSVITELASRFEVDVAMSDETKTIAFVKRR